MPGERFSSSKIYLNVNQGVLRQTVKEGEYEAQKRTYTKKDGSVKTVYEIVYKNFSGIIRRINVKDTEYGKQLEIDFSDARITVQVDSQYFQSFVTKIMGANLSKVILIQPYDFEPNGKRKIGFVIIQDGIKLSNFFYDNNSKKNINGFPEVNEAEKKNEGYWKNYFGYTVRNFLFAQLATLTFGNELPNEYEENDGGEIEEYIENHQIDNSIPTIGETSMVDEAETEEIDINDVPF